MHSLLHSLKVGTQHQKCSDVEHISARFKMALRKLYSSELNAKHEQQAGRFLQSSDRKASPPRRQILSILELHTDTMASLTSSTDVIGAMSPNKINLISKAMGQFS